MTHRWAAWEQRLLSLEAVQKAGRADLHCGQQQRALQPCWQPLRWQGLQVLAAWSVVAWGLALLDSHSGFQGLRVPRGNLQVMAHPEAAAGAGGSR